MTSRPRSYLCGSRSVNARGHLAIELREELRRLDEETTDPVARLKLALLARTTRLALHLLSRASSCEPTVTDVTVDKLGRTTTRERIHPLIHAASRMSSAAIRGLGGLRGGAAEKDLDDDADPLADAADSSEADS